MLPPLEDEELLPIVSPAKHKVPFVLKENMLCYNCNEDSSGRRDLVGWLDVAEDDYIRRCATTQNHYLTTKTYSILLAALRQTFPGLDFDAVSKYCDHEKTCPRPKLIEAWRAFLSNINWDECDEPKPDDTSRKQKRKK